MTIGERIKKNRMERGISTYTIAKITGLSQSSISKLENGKRKADHIILEKIADALNVSIDRLTGDSVSSIIESRLEELDESLETIAKEADVPLYWLQHLDTFTPGELGDYEIGYDWITRVADVLDIPGSTLRTALARQEIPIPDDLPRVTVSEAFGGENTYKPKRNEELGLLSVPEQDHIKKYRDLDPHGKEMVDFTLLKEWERSTAEKPEKNIIPIKPKADPYSANAAHERTDIDFTDEDRQSDEDLLD